MSIPTLEDLLSQEVSAGSDFDSDPIPEGDTFGVITKGEVRNGPKGPYINVEFTVHKDSNGTEDYKGRKAWGVCSFSEKALSMPGGPANLIQSVKGHITEVPKGLGRDETVAWLAENIVGAPVGVEIHHEVRKDKAGNVRIGNDGEPVMTGKVNAYFPAPDEFAAAIEKAAEGLDDDLPF